MFFTGNIALFVLVSVLCNLLQPLHSAPWHRNSAGTVDGNNVADSVSIAISMPQGGNPRAWPVFKYQLAEDVERNRNAFAFGSVDARGGQGGAVAIQHSLAIANIPNDARAESRAFANSS